MCVGFRRGDEDKGTGGEGGIVENVPSGHGFGVGEAPLGCLIFPMHCGRSLHVPGGEDTTAADDRLIRWKLSSSAA